jgi:hypothetical protein
MINRNENCSIERDNSQARRFGDEELVGVPAKKALR